MDTIAFWRQRADQACVDRDDARAHIRQLQRELQSLEDLCRQLQHTIGRMKRERVG